jgi:hypothetical protein
MTDPKLYDAIMKLMTRGVTRVVLTGEEAGKEMKENSPALITLVLAAGSPGIGKTCVTSWLRDHCVLNNLI